MQAIDIFVFSVYLFFCGYTYETVMLRGSRNEAAAM